MNIDIGHEAKKFVAASSPPASPATKVIEEEHQEQSSVLLEAIEVDVLPPQLQPQSPTPLLLPVYDINHLPHDPSERLSIASYHINDQEAIRRAYILKKKTIQTN